MNHDEFRTASDAYWEVVRSGVRRLGSFRAVGKERGWNGNEYQAAMRYYNRWLLRVHGKQLSSGIRRTREVKAS